MKKHLIHFLIIVQSIVFSMAQHQTSYINQYISLDTVLLFPNKIRVNNAPLAYSLWGHSLAFINYNGFISDTIKVCFYDLKTHQINTVHLCVTDFFDKTIRIIFLAHNESYICIGDFHQVYVFRKVEEKYVYDKNIQIDKYVSYVSFLDSNTLFLYGIKNGQNPPSSLSTYHIKTGEKIKEINPDFQHPLFSYFGPKNVIDVKNDKILFSHQRHYMSTIFYKNLDTAHNIEAKHIKWIELNNKYIEKINRKYDITYPLNIIDAVEKKHPHIHQQRWAYLINEDKIICVYQPPYHKNKIPVSMIDIWEKKEDVFELKEQGIMDLLGIKAENDSIGNHSFGLGFLSGSQYVFTDNQVIVFKSYAANINPLYMQLSDFYKQTNEYFLKNSPVVAIYVYTHTF
ncbi:MAG: hypothetical protein GX330_08300 [Bacteroidales bacterium]|nr:hypothetical protein [Bacteroidales bacterium]